MFALEVASLACESASSFPGTPIWLGTQHRATFLPESKIAFLIWLTIGFVGYNLFIAWIELFESDTTVMDWFESDRGVLIAFRMARSSAVNTEADPSIPETA